MVAGSGGCRPFHDHIALLFLDVQSANKDAVALQGFKMSSTTLAGAAESVVISRDHPCIQRRGRGTHPCYRLLTDEVIAGAEKLRLNDRESGLHPYTGLHCTR